MDLRGDRHLSYEMSVTYLGGYVEVRSIGDKSYQTAVKLWREIIKVCAGHNCYKVLGIGESATSMPTMAALDHVKLFRDFEITHKYKIAWVELNKEALASVQFLETVLLNRGMLNGMLFSTIEEARQWLLEDNPE